MMRGPQYQKLPVEQVEKTLASCAANPSWSSFTAALRIGREQIIARDNPGIYRWIIALLLLALIASTGGLLLTQGRAQEMLRRTTFAAGAVLLIMLAVVTRSRQTLAIARQQEQALKVLTVSALTRIVDSPDFTPKELDEVQKSFLRDILRDTKTKNSDLQALL